MPVEVENSISLLLRMKILGYSRLSWMIGHDLSLPVRSVDLNLATRSSDERPDIVMLPREEPLNINCSSLKAKHVTGHECILPNIHH